MVIDPVAARNGNLSAVGGSRGSGWIADEDECRAGDEPGASADKKYVGVLLLGVIRPGPMSAARLRDVPEAVDASRAETAAKGVERQFAVELDVAVLDEIECFAFLAETAGFETEDRRGREAVADLSQVDILRTEARPLPLDVDCRSALRTNLCATRGQWAPRRDRVVDPQSAADPGEPLPHAGECPAYGKNCCHRVSRGRCAKTCRAGPRWARRFQK
jgi:hypothetical protein